MRLAWIVLVGVMLQIGTGLELEFGWEGWYTDIVESAESALSVGVNATKVAAQATRRLIKIRLDNARLALHQKLPEIESSMTASLNASAFASNDDISEKRVETTEEKRVEAMVEFLIDRCIELRLATLMFPDLKPKLVDLAKITWQGLSSHEVDATKTQQKFAKAIDNLLESLSKQFAEEYN
jgi:hypothetical protein